MTIVVTNSIPVVASRLLVMSNQYPAIVYADSTGLHLVKSKDSIGSSWEAPQLIYSASQIKHLDAMLLANHYPAVAFYEATDGKVKFIAADDITGDSWPISAKDVGYPLAETMVSMTLAGNYPAIAYFSNDYSAMYRRANEVTGNSWNSYVHSFSLFFPTDYLSLSSVAAKITLAFATEHLQYYYSEDSLGDIWGGALVDVNVANQDLAVASVADHPALAYQKNSGESISLHYIRSSSSTGQRGSWEYQDFETVQSAVNPGNVSLVQVGSYPTILYDQLKLSYRDSQGIWQTIPIVSQSVQQSSLVNLNGSPAVSYVSGSTDINYQLVVI